ncbi:MAG TPA: hypothetical protein ENG71_01130 [Thermoplasmatales archaeon]|nr:hypothetical protein [Thermoplasmatales archaeon]
MSMKKFLNKFLFIIYSGKMKTKKLEKLDMILFVVLIVGFSMSYSGLNVQQVKALSLGDVLYVGGSGPNNYTTINAALNVADDGDTIYVYSGTYYENIVITKKISLIGENPKTTIIDGRNMGNVVHILSDNVIISGFTLTNSGWEDNEAGLMINGDYCKISNCLIVNNNRGIYGEYANHNIITNCSVSDSKGLSNIAFYYSDYNHFKNLDVKRSKLSGIYFSYGDYNSIERCNIADCYEGYGIGMDYCSHCSVSNCTAKRAINGIKIFDSDNNIFYNNTLVESKGSGIVMYPTSNNNVFIMCKSTRNGYNGIWMRKSSGNTIENCQFENNSICGIYMELYSNENTIQKCEICNNEGCGIYIEQSSGGNTIKMCNIKNNAQIGVYLKKCTDVVYLNYNNIYGNGWGVWANGSICDARYNYWGCFLGPLTFGLIGDGVGWNEKGKVMFFPWKIAEIEW